MDDYKFESIWSNPKTKLAKLKRCSGVITPDFSTYKDMPTALKIYNTYRMRAFGYWLGTQGVKVINNVRWGTPESYSYCFAGIPQNSIVSVGTVGCLKTQDDEWRFVNGLEVMVYTLNPSHILVYGTKGRNFFDKYINAGIPVTFYDPAKPPSIISKKVTRIL